MASETKTCIEKLEDFSSGVNGGGLSGLSWRRGREEGEKMIRGQQRCHGEETHYA